MPDRSHQIASHYAKKRKKKKVKPGTHIAQSSPSRTLLPVSLVNKNGIEQNEIPVQNKSDYLSNHKFITGDIKRMGLFAGVIVIILIILTVIIG